MLCFMASSLFSEDVINVWNNLFLLLLLGGELLAERCRTDDLLQGIPISCLPPCCMDPKVLRLNILINCSQPGGSWATNGSPSVCWWSECSSDDMEQSGIWYNDFLSLWSIEAILIVIATFSLCCWQVLGCFSLFYSLSASLQAVNRSTLYCPTVLHLCLYQCCK